MYKDQKTKRLAEKNIPELLTEMSVPAIIGMLVSAVYNIVDTIFVGRLGTEAIGAVTVAFPLFMIISAIGLAFGIGSASFISRLLGEDNHKKAGEVAVTSVITTFVLGVIMAAAGLYFLRPMLRLFGATESIMPYAYNYTALIIMGSIFTMSNMNMNNMVRAEGSAKMSMIALSTGALLNIILDPILIFYFNLGIDGAAAATVFSQAVSTALLLYFYKSGSSVVRLKLRSFRPSLSIYTEIFKIGLPTLVRQLLSSAAMTVLNNYAAGFNDVAVASVGIINRVFSFGFFVVAGFTQGFQPVAGFSYGAKNFKRLKESIKVTFKRTSFFGFLLAFVFYFFSREVIMVFSSDPAVIETAGFGLKVYSLIMPLIGFSLTTNTLFQAIGHGRPALILSLSRQGLFFIPALMILSNLFGLQGIFMAQTTADFLTFILTVILFFKVKREIDLKERLVYAEEAAA